MDEKDKFVILESLWRLSKSRSYTLDDHALALFRKLWDEWDGQSLYNKYSKDAQGESIKIKPAFYE